MQEIRTLSQLLDALSRGYRFPNKNQVTRLAPRPTVKQEKDGGSFRISIAGHVLEIHSLYSKVKSFCKEYLCDDEPEILISVTDEDIKKEQAHSEQFRGSVREGYLETLTVYRKICEALLQYNTFLMHGAAVAVGSQAFLFTAASGTGKTTHVRKWLENLDEAYIVNGDKPLIRITGREAIVCGTPWCGKERMGKNTMVPLKAVVLMERGEDNTISEISFGEAFPALLQQTYQTDDAEMTRKVLALLSQLKGRTRFYHFIFNNMKDDVFSVAYTALM